MAAGSSHWALQGLRVAGRGGGVVCGGGGGGGRRGGRAGRDKLPIRVCVVGVGGKGGCEGSSLAVSEPVT
jgi:hypothetical protein